MQKQLVGGQHALPDPDDCLPWIPKGDANRDARSLDVAHQFYFMKLNTDELTKRWEEDFYEGAWGVDTLTMTHDEAALVKDIQSLLPRHMPVYDWSRPFAEAILLIVRRHEAHANVPGELPRRAGTPDANTKETL